MQEFRIKVQIAKGARRIFIVKAQDLQEARHRAGKKLKLGQSIISISLVVRRNRSK